MKKENTPKVCTAFGLPIYQIKAAGMLFQMQKDSYLYDKAMNVCGALNF